jgi:hypothetical protein
METSVTIRVCDTAFYTGERQQTVFLCCFLADSIIQLVFDVSSLDTLRRRPFDLFTVVTTIIWVFSVARLDTED